MRKIVVVLVVVCSMVALSAQAEVIPLESDEQCLEPCTALGTPEARLACIMKCDAREKVCINCCHLKLPSASKEHCETSCLKNIHTYRCPK